MKRRAKFVSAEDSSEEGLEVSSVCEDTVVADVAVETDERRRQSITTSHVQRSHFYVNFGDVDFWRKPSVSCPSPYEYPISWTGPPPLVSKKKGTRDSSDGAAPSHQLVLSDAMLDASQDHLTFPRPVRPIATRTYFSRQLSATSRRLFRSTDDCTANFYENAERHMYNEQKDVSRREFEVRRTEATESAELPQVGVMYEENYIPMRSARCTSCPNLLDADLEEDLYVIMDITQERASTEANTKVNYYNVPARIAGIPATYFMPGPLYNLPLNSYRLLPPRTVQS